MLDGLVAAHNPGGPVASPFAEAHAEDAYYRAHTPRPLRLSAVAPLAAIVVLLALAVDVLPR